MQHRTRVQIDLNVRVRGNGTFAGLDDASGPVAVGDVVEVYESESGLAGEGTVTEIDGDRELIFLSLDWAALKVAPADAGTRCTACRKTYGKGWLGRDGLCDSCYVARNPL